MTPAEQAAKTSAEAAAFAARKKTPIKTVMTSAFNLADKGAAIKASRPIVSATMMVTDSFSKATYSEITDRAAVAAAIEAEIGKVYDAAATNNLAGKPRIVKTISITLEVRVT